MMIIRLLIFSVTILFLITFGPLSSLYCSEVAPETEVKVLGKPEENPVWKQLWDSARAYSRDNKREEALETYQQLLLLKPHIEAVKWELGKLYIALQNFPEAAKIVEQLLEIDGHNINYLISAADIALHANNLSRASSLYGKAYEQAPLGAHSVVALTGLAKSFLKGDRQVLAIPLLEQLYVRNEISPELLEKLAFLHEITGSSQQAAFYFSTLLRKYRVKPEIIKKTARIYQEIGPPQRAADYWEHYLREVPDTATGRPWLIDFYLSQNRAQDVLPHLVYLIEKGLNTPEHLLTAAQIYLFTYGRADKALGYYEHYQQRFPEAGDVSEEIADIQLILANDLISIVENSGAWTLWRDLARLTPDRIGIYRAMAELLRDLDKEKEYIEVLEIINSHAPEDWQIADQLAAQYLLQGNFQDCAQLSRQLHRAAPFAKTRSLRAMKCLQGAGRDKALQAVFKTHLAQIPDDYQVLVSALDHAGKLGDIDALQDLFRNYLALNKRSNAGSKQIITLVFEHLVRQGHLTTARTLLRVVQYSEITEYFGGPSGLETAVLFQINERAHRYPEAEQLLRKALINAPEDLEIIVELAHFYWSRGRLNEAQIMFRRAQLIGMKVGLEREAVVSKKLTLLEARLSQALGRDEILLETIRTYLATSQEPNQIGDEDFDILMFLVTKYYREKKLDETLKLINEYRNLFGKNERFLILTNILRAVQQKNTTYQNGESIEGMAYTSIIRKYQAAEIWLRLGHEALATTILESIQKTHNNAGYARLLLAELYQKNGSNQESLKIYQALSRQYPEETFFKLRSYEQLIAAGMYQEFLQQATEYIGLDRTASLPEKPVELSKIPIWFNVARALWAQGDRQYSLKIYKKIKGDLQDSMTALIKKSQRDPLFNSFDTSYFLGLFGVSPPAMEILETMMNIRFFIRNIEEPIIALTNDYFASFTWYKKIDQEYGARTALNQSQFHRVEPVYWAMTRGTDGGHAPLSNPAAHLSQEVRSSGKRICVIEKCVLI